MEPISRVGLIKKLSDVPIGRRIIVAIAGPPGSGKSTLAEKVAFELNLKARGYAAVLPMDGFHFDDLVLLERGHRERKGAPETFDIDGFVNLIQRIRVNDGAVAVPLFDRKLEIARAGARVIEQSARVIIVEGNYLLLDRDRWRALSFDCSVMLTVPRETLRNRLIERWLYHGKTTAQIAAQVESNDMINVDTVQKHSKAPDYTIFES